MTANELADYLDNNVEAMLFSEQSYIDQAATMLRQQQAEIERLIMLCDCMTTESNRKGNEIEELKAKLNKYQIGKFIVWNSTDKAQEK